ncbi:LytR/AlgR family response regulator transcription factor [Pyxidicoccus trucidator]|uniref:LytR/AlgR family response regulator transcription factor n=1 Tax=Pyxidicoccus trucidator TaxID=2709662 RepID=UPI0013DA8F5C|nr:LytTR family DNA-binding domain-containing protein [Pyxidicoccus trucidator]
MRVLVVDDEEPARRRLERMLRELAGVEVVGQAGDAEETLRQVATLRPDLLLLDIHMPCMDGLTLAQRHADLPPVIFVTAHDEHAVQAFEVNAVDYLLKPVRPERLATAMERARQRRLASREAVSRALETVRPAGASTRIVTSTAGTLRFFDARDITRFWSSDKYTVFLVDGAEQMTEEPLSTLEERLREAGFLRVHRGELVHANSIRALRGADGIHEVELRDGQVARVSRRLLAEVKRGLGLD